MSPISAVGSLAFVSIFSGQVVPLSLEHSYWNRSTPAVFAFRSWMDRVPLPASTIGCGGAGGRPIGVTAFDAAIHAPSPPALTVATSHVYEVPFARPSTVVCGWIETPSVDSIGS